MKYIVKISWLNGSVTYPFKMGGNSTRSYAKAGEYEYHEARRLMKQWYAITNAGKITLEPSRSHVICAIEELVLI